MKFDANLRPFQSVIREMWRESTEAGRKRGLVAVPTGAGKTVTGLSCVADHGRSVFLVNRDELVKQTVAAAQACMADIDVGVVQGGDDEVHARDLIVASVQTLCKPSRLERLLDSQVSSGLIRHMIVDEAHHAAAKTWLRVIESFDVPTLGLSVGGESTILVKDSLGNETRTTMEEFHKLVYGADDAFTPVCGYSTRAFDGEEFVWKPIRSVFRHRLGAKKAYQLRLEKGRTLVVTEDHSVFRVKESGKQPRPLPSDPWRKKKAGTLEECLGSDLSVGDYLLLEDRVDESSCALTYMRMTDHVEMRGDSWRVASPHLAGWIKANIEDHKKRWQSMRGAHGPNVSADSYASIAQALPGATVYTTGAKGVSCKNDIPVEALSYLLGFYVGDGWTEEYKVRFAVGSDDVERFSAELRRLEPYATINQKIRKMPGKSVEIGFSNRTLVEFFRSITKDQKAHSKRIPSCVFRFRAADIRRFVDGMLDSDGHLNERGGKDRWHYVTTSAGLAHDLCELLKKLGVVASISERAPSIGGTVDGRKIVGRRAAYTVHFSAQAYAGNNSNKNGRRDPFCIDFDGLPVKIKSIESCSPEWVYDISVDDDRWQTFVASGVLVHNTATPERADKLGLAKVWGPTPLYRMTIDDAIAGRYPLKDGTMAQAEDGWLVPYEARRVELDGLDMSRVKVNPETGDYDLTELEKEVYRADVAGSVARIVAGVVAEGRRPIVFCVSRNQGMRTAEILRTMPEMAGKPVLYVDGTTAENIRSSAVKDFRANRVRVLINCQLYTEGMDAPEIDCVVNAAPTQSRIQYIQRIGRGLRLCRETNKTDLLIVDVVGAQEAHGLVTSANMLEDVEPPKKGKKRKLAHALELQGQRDHEFGMVISTAKASKYGLSDAAAKALMKRHSNRPKWITVLEERVIALPAGEQGALVMIREPGDADLWMGFRLPQDAWDHTNRRRIMPRPAPRSFCAGVVEDRARKLGVFGLSDEAARWRDREPTDEQARHWAKMFPGVPILDTRGATSDAMTKERLRRLFRSFT